MRTDTSPAPQYLRRFATRGEGKIESRAGKQKRQEVITATCIMTNTLMNNNLNKLEIRNRRITPNSVCPCPLGSWPCCDTELWPFVPKIDAFIFVPRVWWNSIPVIHKARKCIQFTSTSDTRMNFDLLTPKLEAFITVLRCTNAESLVKICPTFFKIFY